MTPSAEQFTEPVAEHGEGPVWDAAAGILRFVDMLRGDLLGVHPNDPSTVSRSHVAAVLAAWRPRAGGGAVIATERGFAESDRPDAGFRVVAEMFDTAGVRMNEGGCDTAGRFYAGSMAPAGKDPIAALYRLDTDGRTSTALDGVTVSNGLVFTVDGDGAYYIDTATQHVDRFDYDVEAAALTARRTVVAVDASDGKPDGLAVDAEGGLWVALYGGRQVRHYSPEGRLEDVVTVPASRVTSCTFGGPDLDQLFITTSRENLAPGEEPPAGAVFTCAPGVRGLPVLPYGR